MSRRSRVLRLMEYLPLATAMTALSLRIARAVPVRAVALSLMPAVLILGSWFRPVPSSAAGRSFRVIVVRYIPSTCPGCQLAVQGLDLALTEIGLAMPSLDIRVVEGHGSRCPAHGTVQENTFAIVTGIWPDIRGERRKLGMELQFMAGGRRISAAGLTWDAVFVADSLGAGSGADFCAQIIAHEILHSFGLGHSNDPGSIMYPWLNPKGTMADRLPELRSFESTVLDSLEAWESRPLGSLQEYGGGAVKVLKKISGADIPDRVELDQAICRAVGRLPACGRAAVCIPQPNACPGESLYTTPDTVVISIGIMPKGIGTRKLAGTIEIWEDGRLYKTIGIEWPAFERSPRSSSEDAIRYYEVLVIHELLHTLGADDNSDPASIMYKFLDPLNPPADWQEQVCPIARHPLGADR